MIPFLVLNLSLLVVLSNPTSADQFVNFTVRCADHQPIRIGDERGRLVAASSPVMATSWGASRGGRLPRDRPLRLAAQKSKLHAPLALMRSAPVNFLANGELKLD
jgi:hypothetical protein